MLLWRLVYIYLLHGWERVFINSQSCILRQGRWTLTAFLSCFLLLTAMLQTKISPQLHPNTFAPCVSFAHTLAEPALGQLLAIFLRSRRRKLMPSLTLPLKANMWFRCDLHALEAEQLLKIFVLLFYMVEHRKNPHFWTNFGIAIIDSHFSAYVNQSSQPVQPVPWDIPLHMEVRVCWCISTSVK